jgi:type IV pilus biogenesis protein PilP
MCFTRHARHTVVLTLAFACGSRAAAEVATVNELASLQADRILLSAQLEKLRAQNALTALDASRSPTAVGNTLPSLRLVYGSQGTNVGLFVYSSGSTATATAGDTLPGQLHVRSVELQGADLVDRQGRTVRVPLSSKPPIETRSTVNGSGNEFTHSSSPIN